MKKTNKRVNRGYNQPVVVHLPEIVDMETLSYMGDDELSRRFSYLAGDRDRVYQEGYDVRPWEVEISYVQREMRIRASRRVAHEEFIRANPEPNYYELTYVPNYDADELN